MLLETLRVWASALEDGTYGVNAQIPSVPLDGGDPAPPEVSWIKDVTRDTDVFEGNLPSDWPGLLVEPSGTTAEVDGLSDQGKRDAERVGVVTEYVSGQTNWGRALREALYTQRAMIRTLDDLFENGRESDRTRNNVRLLNCLRLRIGEIRVASEVGRIIVPTEMEMTVRDEAP